MNSCSVVFLSAKFFAALLAKGMETLTDTEYGSRYNHFEAALKHAVNELPNVPPDVADEVRALRRIYNNAGMHGGNYTLGECAKYFADSDLGSIATRGMAAVTRHSVPLPLPEDDLPSEPDKATDKTKQLEENVSERLPQTDAEADVLKPAIAGLLRTIPETWTEFEPDKLTATESTALFLLGAAGLIERRCRLRLRMLNHPTMFEATFTATGERGAVDALKPLAAVIWGEWQDAYRAWKSGDRADVAPVYCEAGKPDEWRLTDQGILARGDFDGTKPNANPDDACDFIFKRGVYGPGYWIWKATIRGLTEDDKQTIQNHRNAGCDTTRLPRPSVCGSGSLVEYRKVDAPTGSQSVNLTNWGEGADAFAAAFGKSLGPLLESMNKAQQMNGLPPAPTAPLPTDTPKQSEGNGKAGATTQKTAKQKRGRRIETDPKADKRIADAWATGQYKTYAELGQGLGIAEREAYLAFERHRARQNRKGRSRK